MYIVEYWDRDIFFIKKGKWQLLDIYLFKYFARRKILNNLKHFGPMKYRLVKIVKGKRRILYIITKTLPRR